MIGVLLVVEQTAEVEISVYLPIDCHNQPTFILCEASVVPASLKTQQLPVIQRKTRQDLCEHNVGQAECDRIRSQYTAYFMVLNGFLHSVGGKYRSECAGYKGCYFRTELTSLNLSMGHSVKAVSFTAIS